MLTVCVIRKIIKKLINSEGNVIHNCKTKPVFKGYLHTDRVINNLLGNIRLTSEIHLYFLCTFRWQFRAIRKMKPASWSLSCHPLLPLHLRIVFCEPTAELCFCVGGLAGHGFLPLNSCPPLKSGSWAGEGKKDALDRRPQQVATCMFVTSVNTANTHTLT